MATSHSDRIIMSKKPTFTSFTPDRTGHFNINGHHLYWECYGPQQSPPVVLLHHGLGSIRSWTKQIPYLAGKGFRVLAVDRWGYDRSDPRPEFAPHFLHKDAQEMVELLKALHVEHASLLGHSDGGSIALIIASRYPDLVQQLILVSAHIYVEPKMAEGMHLIEAVSQTPAFRRMLKQEHGPRAQELVQSWINCWPTHGHITMNLIDELKGVHCPTLVIQGERDEYTTPKHAEDIAQGIKDAKLWLIPDVGHMPSHEVTQQFNERILAFLSEKRERKNLLSTEANEAGNVQ